MDLERFFPNLQFCLSRTFLQNYSARRQRIQPKSKESNMKVKDVLSKTTIVRRYRV